MNKAKTNCGDDQFKIKGSQYRNKIAICLNLWRKEKNIRETARTLKINPTTICDLLRQSKIYLKISQSLKESKKEKQKEKYYDPIYILRWSKKIKAIQLLNGKCIRCGNDNIFQLEFHHVTNNKKYEMNRIWGRDWNTIKSEISKCILLCRNCHTAFHFSDINRYGTKKYEHKINLLKLKKTNKCEKCNFKGDISALDLHHSVGHKEFNISNRYKSQKRLLSVKAIMKEINKCSVLCRNCHKLEHIHIKKFNSLKSYIYNAIDIIV